MGWGLPGVGARAFDLAAPAAGPARPGPVRNNREPLFLPHGACFEKEMGKKVAQMRTARYVKLAHLKVSMWYSPPWTEPPLR